MLQDRHHKFEFKRYINLGNLQQFFQTHYNHYQNDYLYLLLSCTLLHDEIVVSLGPSECSVDSSRSCADQINQKVLDKRNANILSSASEPSDAESMGNWGTIYCFFNVNDIVLTTERCWQIQCANVQTNMSSLSQGRLDCKTCL